MSMSRKILVACGPSLIALGLAKSEANLKYIASVCCI